MKNEIYVQLLYKYSSNAQGPFALEFNWQFEQDSCQKWKELLQKFQIMVILVCCSCYSPTVSCINYTDLILVAYSMTGCRISKSYIRRTDNLSVRPRGSYYCKNKPFHIKTKPTQSLLCLHADFKSPI